jgi:hypothetical protein
MFLAIGMHGGLFRRVNVEELDQNAALTPLAGSRTDLAQPFGILEMRGLARGDTRASAFVIALRTLIAAGGLVRGFCWQSCVSNTATSDPTKNKGTKFRRYYGLCG